MAHGDNPILRDTLLKMPLSDEVAEVLVDYSIEIINKRWQIIEDKIANYGSATKKYVSHFGSKYPELKQIMKTKTIRKQTQTKDPELKISDADDAKITTINTQRAKTQSRAPEDDQLL